MEEEAQVLIDTLIQIEKLQTVIIKKSSNPEKVDFSNSANHFERKVEEFLLGISDRKNIEIITTYLSKPEISSRRRARLLTTLVEIDTKNVYELLIKALEDPDYLFRSTAARGLGRLDDARVVEPLLKALEDPHSSVRGAAINSLGKIKAKKAVEYLIPMLNDPESSIQREAISALALLGDKRAIQPIVQILEQGIAIRDAALALTHFEEAGVEALLQTINSEKPFVSFWSAIALGRTKNARVSAALILLLKSPVARKRAGACYGLGDLGDSRFVGLLVKAANDQDYDVREAAVRSLGTVGSPEILDFLLAILRDKNSDVRDAAAEALGELGNVEAVYPLLAVLDEEITSLRYYAVEALRILGSREALPKLLLLQKTTDEAESWLGDGIKGTIGGAIEQITNPR